MFTRFKKSTYEYENEQFEYLDSLSSTYYVYQNQKIVYKEVWLKSNGQFKKAYEIYYYKNGKPKFFYSYTIRTEWFFDKNENIVAEKNFQDTDNSIVFDSNQYKFTDEQVVKIRRDLRKILHDFDFQRFEKDRRSIKDWKILNRTKKYLKKLFKTEVDIYYQGMSSNFIVFYSEYGKFYSIEDRKVFESGVYDDE